MGMNALLIEDDPALQRATARVIQRTFPDCVIDIVDTADGAIARLRGVEYSIVVSDYDLADGSNGGDVLRWINADAPHIGARFVFFAGNEAIFDHHHERCVLKAQLSIPDLREVFRRAANQ